MISFYDIYFMKLIADASTCEMEWEIPKGPRLAGVWALSDLPDMV
jgi:hypothetical protein